MSRKLSPNQATVIETLRRGGSLSVSIDFRIPKRVDLRDARRVPVAGIRAASVGSLCRAGLVTVVRRDAGVVYYELASTEVIVPARPGTQEIATVCADAAQARRIAEGR